LSSDLLPFEFLRQFALKALLFTRFQKERVLLNLFDNALLLNLALEAPEGAFDGFTVKNADFCQNFPPLNSKTDT
jgi:hypothetical protein